MWRRYLRNRATERGLVALPPVDDLDDRALHIALDRARLRKQRALAVASVIACTAGTVVWLLIHWPRSGIQVTWFGSPMLGWIWLFGFPVLFVQAIVVGAHRFMVAT